MSAWLAPAIGTTAYSRGALARRGSAACSPRLGGALSDRGRAVVWLAAAGAPPPARDPHERPRRPTARCARLVGPHRGSRRRAAAVEHRGRPRRAPRSPPCAERPEAAGAPRPRRPARGRRLRFRSSARASAELARACASATPPAPARPRSPCSDAAAVSRPPATTTSAARSSPARAAGPETPRRGEGRRASGPARRNAPSLSAALLGDLAEGQGWAPLHDLVGALAGGSAGAARDPRRLVRSATPRVGTCSPGSGPASSGSSRCGSPRYSKVDAALFVEARPWIPIDCHAPSFRAVTTSGSSPISPRSPSAARRPSRSPWTGTSEI